MAYSDGDELEEESSPEPSLVNIDDIIDEALLDDFLNPEDDEETPTPGDNASTPSPQRRQERLNRKGGKSANDGFSSDEEEPKSPSFLKKVGGLFSFF